MSNRAIIRNVLADDGTGVFRDTQVQMPLYGMPGGSYSDLVLAQDPWIQFCIDEIYSTYGDIVFPKPKQLRKFGRTQNADIDVKTTIADFQGAVVNETYATGNTIDRLVSTSESDAGKVFTIEGHTQDETTGDFTFRVQNVTCLGQTPATLSVPLARANRNFLPPGTFASPSTDVVGDVSVYDSSVATTAPLGVPSVDTATKIIIKGTAGRNQSDKCATTIGKDDYWMLTIMDPSVGSTGPQDATVLAELEYRQLGGVWRPLGIEVYAYGGSVTPPIQFKPYAIIPKNSDVRAVGTSNKADTRLSCRIVGQLLAVQ